MIYAQIVVVAKDRHEMMRIIGELYNARRREFSNNGIDPPHYDFKSTNDTGGRFIIREYPEHFHEYDRPLEKHLDDLA